MDVCGNDDVLGRWLLHRLSYRGAALVIAFGYTRVSGQGQVEKDGFPRQNEALNAFCRKHGLALEQIFREEAVSGTVEGMDRPEFSKMITIMEERGVQAFVVERMDRLARDLMVSELLLGECRKRGIMVFAVDQGTLTDMASDGVDPTRKLIRQIMGALAEWDKSNLVKRLRLSRERVRARGERCEGRKPFGSKPGEQAIKTAIFNLRENGMSLPKMAAFLNESGVQNKYSRDGKWTKTVVAKFLQRHREGYYARSKEKEKEEEYEVLKALDGHW